MSSYIILKHLKVQRANTVAGFTYGFPSVGSFLGFVHALSRKMEERGNRETFTKVSILHHDSNIYRYRSRWYNEYTFSQQRTPILKDGSTRPIIEEGKMSMDVSLVLTLENVSLDTDAEELCRLIQHDIYTMRLSGGNIIGIGEEGCVHCEDDDRMMTEVSHLYPFSALADRSDLFMEEASLNEGHNSLEALMSFCEVYSEYEADDDGGGKWVTKNQYLGYLVPCHFGYKAISDKFECKNDVQLRNRDYEGVFVEPVHSVAEWVCSVSKYKEYFNEDMNKIFWQFHNQDDIYYLFNKLKGDIHGK